jgi:hypothetical protein
LALPASGGVCLSRKLTTSAGDLKTQACVCLRLLSLACHHGLVQRAGLAARTSGGAQGTLASVLVKAGSGLRHNEHLEHDDGALVFRHACKLGLEGIVSKRLGSRYRSGRSADWLKMKNPDAPAVKREAEEDWGKDRWRRR